MAAITIKMIRKNLDHFPEYFFPAGFGCQWYRPGDEHAWVEIHKKADQTFQYSLEMFEKEFAEARNRLGQRQCYVTDPEGNLVGTATAWLTRDSDDAEIGLVHWVAITPEMQGRGLAKPLMSVICKKFVEFGYSKARLATDLRRLPAIGLYLKFGFVPEIHSETEFFAWAEVLKDLGQKKMDAVITVE